MSPPASVFARLRHAVDIRGWTDVELCQRAGISRSTVLRLWREDVGWDTVHRVALVLRMDLDLVDRPTPGADEGFEMLRRAGVRS